MNTIVCVCNNNNIKKTTNSRELWGMWEGLEMRGRGRKNINTVYSCMKLSKSQNRLIKKKKQKGQSSVETHARKVWVFDGMAQAVLDAAPEQLLLRPTLVCLQLSVSTESLCCLSPIELVLLLLLNFPDCLLCIELYLPTPMCKVLHWSPTVQCNGIWRLGLWEMLKFEWGHEGGTLTKGLASL